MTTSLAVLSAGHSFRTDKTRILTVHFPPAAPTYPLPTAHTLYGKPEKWL